MRVKRCSEEGEPDLLRPWLAP